MNTKSVLFAFLALLYVRFELVLGIRTLYTEKIFHEDETLARTTEDKIEVKSTEKNECIVFYETEDNNEYATVYDNANAGYALDPSSFELVTINIRNIKAFEDAVSSLMGLTDGFERNVDVFMMDEDILYSKIDKTSKTVTSELDKEFFSYTGTKSASWHNTKPDNEFKEEPSVIKTTNSFPTYPVEHLNREYFTSEVDDQKIGYSIPEYITTKEHLDTAKESSVLEPTKAGADTYLTKDLVYETTYGYKDIEAPETLLCENCGFTYNGHSSKPIMYKNSKHFTTKKYFEKTIENNEYFSSMGKAKTVHKTSKYTPGDTELPNTNGANIATLTTNITDYQYPGGKSTKITSSVYLEASEQAESYQIGTESLEKQKETKTIDFGPRELEYTNKDELCDIFIPNTRLYFSTYVTNRPVSDAYQFKTAEKCSENFPIYTFEKPIVPSDIFSVAEKSTVYFQKEINYMDRRSTQPLDDPDVIYKTRPYIDKEASKLTRNTIKTSSNDGLTDVLGLEIYDKTRHSTIIVTSFPLDNDDTDLTPTRTMTETTSSFDKFDKSEISDITSYFDEE
ncbi:hypothetical protein BB560_004019, partial [Smittium megazygosporum]